MQTGKQVIVIGAGLAGLSCAIILKRMGISFIVLEASDSAGGRIRTDRLDGFLLDRGFQVLLTEYPEAKTMLDYFRLDLKKFRSGAVIRCQGRFHKFFDPWREPSEILSALFSPICSIQDKLKIAKLKILLSSKTINQMLGEPETTTINALKEYGFSQEIIERFFRPFFGGIFLDRQLYDSSRLFNFLFHMFSSGAVAIPRLGMQVIPRQLAEQVGDENIRLNAKVASVRDNLVLLQTGETFEAPHIVIATQESAAEKLLGNARSITKNKSVTCLYYAASKAPTVESVLVLNGENAGPINNLCVLSNISKAYAPDGMSLISVSVVDDKWQTNDKIEEAVRLQLVEWYGKSVENWRHLRTYKISPALPYFNSPTNFLGRPIERQTGHYLCGDYMSTGSINGAIESGRKVASVISKKVF